MQVRAAGAHRAICVRGSMRACSRATALARLRTSVVSAAGAALCRQGARASRRPQRRMRRTHPLARRLLRLPLPSVLNCVQEPRAPTGKKMM